MSKPRTTGRHGFPRDLTRFRTQNFAAARNTFENFGRKSAANRTQSHVPQHANALDTCWGPLRVVGKLRTTWRHGFRRRIGAISDAKVCGREKFSKISIRNALQIARKLTRRGVPTLTKVLEDLCGSWRGCASSGGTHFGVISRENFAAAKNFRKFRSEIR